jgi:AraC family transcriptional regulator
MSAPFSNSPANPSPVNRLTDTMRLPTMECRVSCENLSRGADWAIHESRHTAIIHLDGPIHQLETELEGSGALLDPPMRGELWLIPAGQRYASAARGETIRYAELFFDPAYLRELGGLSFEPKGVVPRVGQFDPFLHQSVQYLISLMHHTDDVSQMLKQTLGHTLGLHLFRAYGKTHNRPNEIKNAPVPYLNSATVKLLRDYIANRLGERITLEALARRAQMSTHNLLRAFRREFGTTPAQYIIAQRLRRARWLLSKTTNDITTISIETGFASHSHFTTTFKTQFGLTPLEFRRLSRHD